MCGQSGAFTNLGVLSDYDLDHARKLLILNQFRGLDSVGAMSWWKEPKKKASPIQWMKRKEHPAWFNSVTYAKEIKPEFTKLGNPNLFATHCRAATIGKIEEANAHPFQHGDIIGMHNGSIHAAFTNKNKFDTDSEALYYNISTMGLKDAIKDLEWGSPAYALVWIDAKKQTLNFLRNKARPLHIYHKGHTLFWSSEFKDLYYTFFDSVDPKVSVKTKHGHEQHTVLYLKEDMHYEIDLTADGDINWSLEEVKPPVKSYHYNEWQGNGSNFQQAGQATRIGTHTMTGVTGSSSRHYVHGMISWDLLYKSLTAFYFAGSDLVPKKTDVKQCYAIEMGKWVSKAVYATLCLWRMGHKEEFFWAVEAQLMGRKQEELVAISEYSNLTLNQIRALARGKFTNYIKEPEIFEYGANSTLKLRFHAWEIQAAKSWQTVKLDELRPQIDRLTNFKKTEDYIFDSKTRCWVLQGGTKLDDAPFDADDESPAEEDELHMQLAKEDAKSNVVPFERTATRVDSEGVIRFPFGVHSYGTKEEILKKMSKCVWCDDTLDWNDYLSVFWVNENACLCPSCQEKTMDGSIDPNSIPRAQALPLFVQERIARERAINQSAVH